MCCPDPAAAASVEPMSDPERTLLLLRHAKSDYPDGVADHDRPLAPRGVREAGLAGDWIKANAPTVDAVLCSTATRTRETLLRTGIDAPTEFVERLYDSTPGVTLGVVNEVGALFDVDVRTLLVIGHEPTTSELAQRLAGRGDADAIARMSVKYPTSAIAMLRTAAPWNRLEVGGATLAAFHVPR